MSVSSYRMSVYLTCPRCQLLSASVSVTVKDAVVVQRDYGGMTLFVTVVMDSSLSPKEHVQAPFLKGCLCVSHSLTHRVAQNAPLELTTKACLSNCAGIRLGYKETHKANVSISCSSESLCLYNQEKHGLNLRWCLGNDAHKTPLYDVDISLNNRFAF